MEDKLTNMREYYETIEANYQRWSYMIWLLNIPNRASKRTKKYKEDQDLIAKFSLAKSDAAAQHAENAEALKNFRSEIKLLKKQIKETKNK